MHYVLPDLIKRHVIDPDNPIIHLRISGDSRNVGRKVKHVMVTCTILHQEVLEALFFASIRVVQRYTVVQRDILNFEQCRILRCFTQTVIQRDMP